MIKTANEPNDEENIQDRLNNVFATLEESHLQDEDELGLDEAEPSQEGPSGGS